MEKGQNLDNLDNKYVRERAEALYREGAEAWRQGERGRAMTLYSESAALWPDGPGAVALRMSNDIMDFYDTNQFNP